MMSVLLGYQIFAQIYESSKSLVYPEVPPRRGELPSETITRWDFPALGKISYMTTIEETFTWRRFQPM